VLPTSRTSTSDGPAATRLHSNFAVTLAGNAVFAASQWAVLSLIAKLGGGRMLGEYALAVAIVSPIALFSHLNLRAVVATDIEGRHTFGDYLAVRLGTTVLAMAAILGIALAARYPWELAAAIGGIGVVLSLDNLSDICYGVMQRRERMDQVALSTAARGLLSAAGVALALVLTGSLLAAVCAQMVARLAVLAAYDGPRGAVGESLARTGLAVQATIARTALPLGAVMMLVSLSGNLPRYAIARRLGTLELAVFAAVTSFQTVGSTVINALGQAATPRLARYFSSGESRRFLRLTAQLAGVAVLLGAAGVLTAWLVGRWALAVLYRAEYAAYSGLLISAMAAAVLAYAAGALGYAITGARAFAAQAPLFALVAAASGLASWLLVPRMGLQGAILALAIAWTVQIAGELAILRGALRGRTAGKTPLPYGRGSELSRAQRAPRKGAVSSRVARLLLAALVFSLPFEKAVEFPGLGTISRVLGMAAFAAGAVAVARRGRLRPPNAALLLAAGFVAWSGLTFFWSLAPQATAARFLTLVQLLGMFWLVWELGIDAAARLLLMRAYLAGAAVSSLWTILRAALNLQTNYRRFATAGFDPNDLGVTLALALPVALYLSHRARGLEAVLARMAAALAITAILLTASRTALIAAGVSFVFALLTWREARLAQRAGSLALVALLILGALRLAPSASRRRLATLPAEVAHGTFHDRTRLWKTSLKLLRHRWPAGVGAAAFPEAVVPWLGRSPNPALPYTAHDTFLSVLVETGAPGFLLFATLVGTLALYAWMLAPAARALWFTMLAVWVAGVSTLSWETRKPAWLMFALIAAAWARAWDARESES